MNRMIGKPFDLPPVVKNHIETLRIVMTEHNMAFGALFAHAIGLGDVLVFAEGAPLDVQRTMLEDLQKTATEMLNMLDKVN